MSKRHHPMRGSRGFSPRKKARSHVPHIKSWPDGGDEPKLQGFAGYKAGMTHAIYQDLREHKTTARMHVRMPITVIEAPPMRIAAVRLYTRGSYGMKTLTEIWSKDLDADLRKKLPMPKNFDEKAAWKKVDMDQVEDVRVLTYTLPRLISGIPKKKPDLMEQRIGGGTVEARVKYAKGLLGKEIEVTDFITPGSFVDVSGITKGKGFQGVVKRFGVKLLSHKNSKHRRMIGNLGPFSPGYVNPKVAREGQTGYHQRTEFNKQVIKVVAKPKDKDKGFDDPTPKGGFLHYGNVKNSYIVIHGSVPGPAKRLVRFRDAIRCFETDTSVPEIEYLSLESKQGV